MTSSMSGTILKAHRDWQVENANALLVLWSPLPLLMAAEVQAAEVTLFQLCAVCASVHHKLPSALASVATQAATYRSSSALQMVPKIEHKLYLAKLIGHPGYPSQNPRPAKSLFSLGFLAGHTC